MQHTTITPTEDLVSGAFASVTECQGDYSQIEIDALVKANCQSLYIRGVARLFGVVVHAASRS